jgi:hypothetical protein
VMNSQAWKGGGEGGLARGSDGGYYTTSPSPSLSPNPQDSAADVLSQKGTPRNKHLSLLTTHPNSCKSDSLANCPTPYLMGCDEVDCNVIY